MPELGYNPKFKESMRTDVCNGKLCPTCLGTKVKNVGSNPDGIHVNNAYDCTECGAQWEGF